MRVACLFDIHGNLPALDAVLEESDVAAADLIVAGGDVAYGPMPAETLDRLAQLGKRVRFVRGNCDRHLVDAYERWAAGALATSERPSPPELTSNWAAARLSPSHRELLATFEPFVELALEGLGEIALCHATPRSDEEIVTALTDEQQLLEALADNTADIVVAGHTHVQLDRRAGRHRFLNAGSVGMPYEDAPGAYWLMLGPEISMRQTSYDYASAAEEIRATGYPEAEELVRECLLDPIGTADATSHFDRIARTRSAPFSSP